LLGGIIDAIDFKLIEKYIVLFSALLLITLVGLGYIAWRKLHIQEDPVIGEEKN
jgi:hypothetical protein